MEPDDAALPVDEALHFRFLGLSVFDEQMLPDLFFSNGAKITEATRKGLLLMVNLKQI